MWPRDGQVIQLGTVFRDPKGHIQNCSANLYLNLVKHQIFNFRLINIKYGPQVYISAHAHTQTHTYICSGTINLNVQLKTSHR